MNFQVLFPQKILFKNGIINDIGKIIKGNFEKPLIITGGFSLRNNEKYNLIIESLNSANIEYFEYKGISAEPSPEIIDKVTDYAIGKNIKSVISIGGGSVIDTGKAVCALVVNEKGVENYLEGVGKGYTIKNNPIPFIAVPTTAGSGAEATKNAVVTSYEKKYKKSFRDDRMMAKLIIVDPELTLSLPKKETAFGGMDAICQLIESMVTKKSNIICKSYTSYFLPRAIDAVIGAYNNPDDLNAREIMIASSLVSGISLANSGLGAVHGFASGIGGLYNIPHGLICAILLPGICRLNYNKDHDIYKEVACLINKDKSEDIVKMIDTLSELNRKLDIPENFKSLNLKNVDPREIVNLSKGSSMDGNPVELSDDVLEKFIGSYF
jgi:alcohol dehydrogenase class IV